MIPRFPAAVFAACFALALLAPRASAAAWDKAAALKYNDERVKAWLDWPTAKARGGGKTRCVSCHTAVPMALARPGLGDETQPEKDLVANARSRVDLWDKIVSWDGTPGDPQPFYPGSKTKQSLATESVLNALILVNHDVQRNKGKLSAAARKALATMWSTQEVGGGGWRWLDFGLRPWEKDGDYYGAALAAVAVGMAGKPYHDNDLSDAEKKKLGKLRDHLAAGYKNESLHNRLAALWASTYLPDILTAEQQKKLTEEALGVGGEEAKGWALTALAKKPTDDATWTKVQTIPDGAKFDGYATAYIVFVLRRAGVRADAGRVAKALAWLAEERVAEGKGPVHYLNRERKPDSADDDEATVGKFMRDAAAAYASLALRDE
jgi:hypothetical protein